MRQNLISLLAGALLLLLSGQAQANLRDWLNDRFSGSPVDYGFWSCPSCYIPNPQEPTATTALADIQAFILANNDEIHSSRNERVHRWLPNSRISICNSSGVCITVLYRPATVLWMPVAPSYPKPPGVEPKNPQNQPVSQTQPSGTVALDPVGMPDPYHGQWSITIPDLPQRELTPSVTVIQDGNVNTYTGPALNLEPLSWDIGTTLNWSYDTYWLNGGGCAVGDPYCMPP